MAKIHLDPWTDIVNVGWPSGTITHVAFEVRMFDGQIGSLTYDYPLTIGDIEGEGTTSLAMHSQRVFLQINSYKQLRVNDGVKTWSDASAAAMEFTGFDGFLSVLHSKEFAECEHWVYINGGLPTGGGNQAMFGFDSQRTGDTDINVPGQSDNFSSATTTGVAFWTHPITSCTPTVVDPGTTLNLSAIERVEIAANALVGVSVRYRDKPCTIAGLWTPSVLLSPAPGITSVEVPKRLWVLAEIN